MIACRIQLDIRGGLAEPPPLTNPRTGLAAMIISHRYRFIFLKTSKTAGTSIEIALSRFCGPDDVITPISEEDEVIRREHGGVGPQNYQGSAWQRSPSDWWKWLRGKPVARFYNHIPARKVKRRVPADVWNGYFKFCICRNPWDRVISQYFWRNRDLPKKQWPSMSEFLRTRPVESLQRKGFKLYTLNGRVAVDRVCRYEDLAEELESVRQQIGLPEPLELPRAKGSHRRDRRSYREVLSEQEQQEIAEYFRPEVALFYS